MQKECEHMGKEAKKAWSQSAEQALLGGVEKDAIN